MSLSGNCIFASPQGNLQDKFCFLLHAATAQMFFLRQMLLCPTPGIVTPELLFCVYTASVPEAAEAASQWFLFCFVFPLSFLSSVLPAQFKQRNAFLFSKHST